MQKSIQKTIRLDSYVYNIINNYKDGDSFNAKLENLIKFCFKNLDDLEAEKKDIVYRINYEAEKLEHLQNIFSQFDCINHELNFISSKLQSIIREIYDLEVVLDEKQYC